jgi:hypothetical protein
MVSKNKKKPIKIKYVRGAGLGDLFKLITDDTDKINVKIREWEKLKNEFVSSVVSDIKKSLAIKDDDDGTYGSNISEEELRRIVDGFNSRIVKRGDNFIQRSEGDEVCNNNQDDKLYDDFDHIFLSILTKINDNINEQEDNISKDFEKIINLLKKLPGIKTNLGAIVDKDISSFNARFYKIIDLLQNECGGFVRQMMCSTAVNIISAGSRDDSIQKLYDYLFTLPKDNICDKDLIKFIKDVIPIIEKNLAGVKEFKDYLTKLKTANEVLSEKSVGGKKSSRAGRKEIHGKQKKIYIKSNYKNKDKDIVAKTSDKPVIIAKKIILGKERCIYKIQGSKREHVKYKGSIITVTDYKKLMKAL